MGAALGGLGRLKVAAMVGSVAFGVAVFLPWVRAPGGFEQAGWGSGDLPQLRGMLVIACAAAAVTCLAVPATARRRTRVVVVAIAMGAAVAALVASASVIAGPNAFAGVARGAAVDGGPWVAVAGELLTIVTAPAALLPGRSSDRPAPA